MNSHRVAAGPSRPGPSDDRAPGRLWQERHLKWLFWACAVVLSPWVVFLYFFQVPSGPAHHIHLLAVGLLLAMMSGLLLTAWTCRRGRLRSVMAASFTATVVCISVRFRILTQAGGAHWPGSVPVLLTVDGIVAALCVTVIWTRLTGRAHPRWLPVALTIMALALIPSLIVVLTVAPTVQTAHHLRVAWAGLDLFEVAALAATGFALHRRSAFAVIPATVTGTLLVCDAWLNVVPSTGLAFWEGIAMAFIELPLAAISFWVAARVSSQARSLR
jgi:hypothetical protein